MFFPSGHSTVTVTIFTSASEPKTGGCIFSILQLAESNLFSSEIDLNSSDDIVLFIYDLFPF
ncbi:MAG TPA: hypothetical protein VFJ05_00015, partial [Nitrososphaeraceae archaeon]|nr:hypothetical protein [Nitrososphaeraceae archaeon]